MAFQGACLCYHDDALPLAAGKPVLSFLVSLFQCATHCWLRVISARASVRAWLVVKYWVLSSPKIIVIHLLTFSFLKTRCPLLSCHERYIVLIVHVPFMVWIYQACSVRKERHTRQMTIIFFIVWFWRCIARWQIDCTSAHVLRSWSGTAIEHTLFPELPLICLGAVQIKFWAYENGRFFRVSGENFNHLKKCYFWQQSEGNEFCIWRVL